MGMSFRARVGAGGSDVQERAKWKRKEKEKVEPGGGEGGGQNQVVEDEGRGPGAQVGSQQRLQDAADSSNIPLDLLLAQNWTLHAST